MRTIGLGLTALLGFCGLGIAVLAPGCSGDSNDSTFDGGNASSSGTSGSSGFTNGDGSVQCTGLECNQKADCPGGVKTTVTGKVYDPAGKVPLFNVTVYVPNTDPSPITPGLSGTCDRCDGEITGQPIASTTTDATGSFILPNVPADVDFRIVMQIGKWRRIVSIPKVTACQTQALTDANVTRLPKNHSEGDIPRIALATGGADPFECMFRKIGLDVTEFGQPNSDSRVQMYAGGGYTQSSTNFPATSSFAAGGSFPSATSFWGDSNQLKNYDIVVMGCEGDENPTSKPIAARQALYDYAKGGGRVFTSHYHHYWFSNSPVPEVKALATWVNDFTCTGGSCVFEPEPLKTATVLGTINTGFAKGQAMHDWLQNTGSLTGAGGTLPIIEGRENVDAVTPNMLSWMTIQNPANGNKVVNESVSFNTPVGASDTTVCGRVVYSDLHVGAGDNTNVPFPNGCNTGDLTPQQKALEFMIFDLSSCIQKDDSTLPK
jgi:hypothetical protein